MKKKLIFPLCAGLILGISVILISLAAGGDSTPGPYEAYYRNIIVYPHDTQPGYHVEVQGVAHDQDHWYITQQDALWKIPVEFDLDDLPDSDLIRVKGIVDVSAICSLGYDHFGDLDYYNFNGSGYLVIPIEDTDDTCGEQAAPYAFAIFKTNYNLDFVGFDTIDTNDGSWIAVDKAGKIVTSPSWTNTTSLVTYDYNWAGAAQSPPVVDFTLTMTNTLEDWDKQPLNIHRSQGAAFSESGELLYVAADGDNDLSIPCAIHVFDTTGTNWRRIAVSSQQEGAPFYYSCDTSWNIAEESEGVDYWDLDNGRAPNIRGQLHVLQLDNETFDSDDTIFFEHFTNVIHVDRAYGGGDGDGTVMRPYTTTHQAQQLAWHGSKIKIQGGAYPEAVTFSKYIQVSVKDGAAVLGPERSLWISKDGAINLSAMGQVKVFP